VIDPARGGVAHDVAVGVRPGDIAADGQEVWVDNIADRSVSRIDAREAEVTGAFSLEGATVDALALGRGALWTVDFPRARVLGIDPGSRRSGWQDPAWGQAGRGPG
jgi:DNA-binding beta-propeller fold protein YncE